MHFSILKFKICNFLSFLGEYEINLKPFSAIMCNYHQGKEDFLQCFEFVFGSNLNDLKTENLACLIHKLLREEFLINQDMKSYVEVTLTMTQENKILKFRRSIKKGDESFTIEHKVSDIITSKRFYEEKLNSLGLGIKQKNLIFYKSFFNNIIWGSAEDLEMTICSCLRKTYKEAEWKQAFKEVERLSQLKRSIAEKNYNSIKKCDSVIAQYIVKLEDIILKKEKLQNTFLRASSTSSEILNTVTNSTETEKISEIYEMENESNKLAEKLKSLKLKQAILLGQLYHEEIKLAADPANGNVLQNRIDKIEKQIREEEKKLSKIQEESMQQNLQLESLSKQISFQQTSLLEILNNNSLQDCFTVYGRFNEYLQPSEYLPLLKKIIGTEIFEAHLCDSLENAFHSINLIKTLKYERREVFISFDNYSHKLKDIITASGEKGVQINTLQQLLIFLCKLKYFGLIEKVPVLTQKDFNYDESIPKDYVIFVKNGLQFTEEGLISYACDENLFCMETEAELQKNLIELYCEEEVKFQEWNDLIFSKYKILSQINELENDVFCLRHKWKKITQEPFAGPKSSQIIEEILGQLAEERQEQERESQQGKTRREESSQKFKSSASDGYLNLKTAYSDVIKQIQIVDVALKSLNIQLRCLCTGPYYEIRLSKPLVSFYNINTAKIFFEKEFKKLKKLMTEDDLDDYMSSQNWRKIFIASLIKDSNKIKNKLKFSNNIFLAADNTKQKKLSPLIEHLSNNLNTTFNHLMDNALPFIDLNINSSEKKLQFMSCMGVDETNIVDIKHFNTFLRFMSCLSVFLELANHEKIPIILFDELEEYFPLHDEDLETVVDTEVLEKIIPAEHNIRFHLLMRVGQFLEHYIKKNDSRNHVQNNGRHNFSHNISGPTQILYFAKEDFIHAANHHIWIHSQILPEELATEDCAFYSEIHEIHFEEENN